MKIDIEGSIWGRIQIVFLTFLDACERFWDNRFRRLDPDDEKLYLRTELDKARMEYYRLAELFTKRNDSVETEPYPETEFKPLGGRPHWRVTANELSRNSRIEKERRDKERINSRSVPIQSTEQLEQELLQVE